MIFLDLDGVIANIGQAVANIYDIKLTPELEAQHGNTLYKLMGLDTKQKLWDVISDIPSFWEDIPPYPWCEELVDALQSVDEVQILTLSPKADANASTGKVKWVGKHLLKNKLEVNIVHDKYLLAGPGRVLIDDRENHCIRFREYNGTSILFKQPWNNGIFDSIGVIHATRTHGSIAHLDIGEEP